MLAILKKSLGDKKYQGFLKYFKNTLWLFVEKCLKIFSVVFIGAWIARYLGPKDYGVFSYCISYVSIFIALAYLGLNEIVIQKLVTHPHHKNKIIGTALGLRIGAALISFVLILLSTQLLQQEETMFFLIFLLSFRLFIQCFEVFDSFFQSIVQAKYSVYARLIALAVISISNISLILLKEDIYAFIIAILIELLVMNSLYGFFFYRLNNFKPLNLQFSRSIAKALLSKSWPLLLSGLMFVCYIRVDQLMVKEILGEKEAGIYSVALNLSEGWYFIAHIITASLFPSILKARTISEKLYHSRLVKIYRLMFWISVCIALFMTFFGGKIIDLIYDERFIGAFPVMKLYIWSNVFYFFTTVGGKWLISENLTIHSFYKNALGAFINIVLNVLLLERYGLIGAALATCIAYSFVGFWYDAIVKPMRKNFILKIRSLWF